MANAIQQIFSWAESLSLWEQVALDLIVSGSELDETKKDQLLNILLSENGLFDGDIKVPEIQFSGYKHADNVESPYFLKSISKLTNINALVGGQILEFGKKLTAIYGINGSGKSGYARVLASLGFSRGDEIIIPDITKPYSPDSKQTVEISFDDEGGISSFEQCIGNPCPKMSSFYVFDSTSVTVHLTKENTITFSPFGLAYLNSLAKLTDEVRNKLRIMIEARSRENLFTSLFHGETEVKGLIENLNGSTDLLKLENLTKISQNEIDEYNKRKSRVVTIKTQGISSKISFLEKEKEDISKLMEQLRKIHQYFCDDEIFEANEEISDLLKCISRANELGLDTFKSGEIESVGSNEWFEFVSTAKVLAKVEEAKKGEPYPKENSHCLFCQQPLSGNALQLINKMWRYLESEAQKQLQKSFSIVEKRILETNKINTEIYKDEFSVSRVIRSRNSELDQLIISHLQRLETFKNLQLDCLKNKNKIDQNELTQDLIPQLDQLITDIDSEILSWRLEEGELDKLEKENLEYEHRQILAANFQSVKDYVNNQSWIEKASTIGGTTRHITVFYNSLFSSLVTEDYIIKFENTLTRLGRPLKVKICTHGSKGEVYKQLILEAHDTTPKEFSNPEKVLSEGEKRAVALADFLTEVSIDVYSRGIILDDPVTSLDIAWRRKIAEVLVEEANERQVIVFTHDMPFLYYLCNIAKETNVDIANHWIKRGDIDNLPGYIFLNNSPALEKDYKNDQIARECYSRAVGAEPQTQLIIIREGFGALRTSYEALIIFELFNGVVKRFDEKISFMNLRDLVWDKDLVEEIIEKCEYCSRFIEGHLHSDEYSGELPTPKILLEEIENYDQIRKELKELKKGKS